MPTLYTEQSDKVYRFKHNFRNLIGVTLCFLPTVGAIEQHALFAPPVAVRHTGRRTGLLRRRWRRHRRRVLAARRKFLHFDDDDVLADFFDAIPRDINILRLGEKPFAAIRGNDPLDLAGIGVENQVDDPTQFAPVDTVDDLLSPKL